MSTCKICGATSEEVLFYKRVSSRCANCHKAAVKANRDQNADYYRAYDAKRFQEDPKVKARHKRYQATDAGRASMQESRRKWINKKPEARAAHLLLGNAVRDGRVAKPTECSVCKKTTASRRLHAHHEDYVKPLDVIWLCAQCHHDRHKDD